MRAKYASLQHHAKTSTSGSSWPAMRNDLPEARRRGLLDSVPLPGSSSVGTLLGVFVLSLTMQERPSDSSKAQRRLQAQLAMVF